MRCAEFRAPTGLWARMTAAELTAGAARRLPRTELTTAIALTLRPQTLC
jgi:hypothetical protein